MEIKRDIHLNYNAPYFLDQRISPRYCSWPAIKVVCLLLKK